MATKRSREKHAKHIDKKLRNRLQIYFFISLVMLAVVIFEVATGVLTIILAGIGVILGIIVGFLTARMFHISWDKDAKKIVSRLDLFGILILAGYILFSLFRGRIIEHFIHGPAVGGLSIALATGVMIGRFFGTRGKIRQLLKEQQVFH